MTSDIKACSECGCSFEQNMIKEVLHQFPPVVTTLVVKFAYQLFLPEIMLQIFLKRCFR